MDLVEEFQKKRDFVEEYTSLAKETYGLQKAKDDTEEAYNSISEAAKKH